MFFASIENGMEESFLKVLDLFRKLEEIFLVGTMVIILILIFSQAFFRYFFGSGLIWGEELARYLHIAQVWLGASLVIKTGGHIRITFFRDLFNKKIKKYIDLTATLLFFLFMFFIAYEGTQFIIQIFGTGQKSPSMGILMAIPYTVVPIGGLMMAIRLLQQMRSILQGNLLEEQM